MFVNTKESEEVKFIIRVWNSFAKKNSIRAVRGTTPYRTELINSALRCFSPADMRKVLRNIKNSDFLIDKEWLCLDWVLRRDHLVSILENKYSNKFNTTGYTGGSNVRYKKETI